MLQKAYILEELSESIKSKGFLSEGEWAQGHPDEYVQLLEKKHKLLSAISEEQGS